MYEVGRIQLFEFQYTLRLTVEEFKSIAGSDEVVVRRKGIDMKKFHAKGYFSLMIMFCVEMSCAAPAAATTTTTTTTTTGHLCGIAGT